MCVVDEEEKEEWVESIWVCRDLNDVFVEERVIEVNGKKEKEVVNDMEEEVIERDRIWEWIGMVRRRW